MNHKIKFKVSPLFLLLLLMFAINDMIATFFVYLFVLLIHEFAHYFVAKKLGYRLNSVLFLPFGVGISGEDFFFKKDEIYVAIAGPLINFFLLISTLALWWIFPETYIFTCDFAIANYITCLFNLLPAFPLDGGRVLNAILKQKYTTKNALKITNICGFIVSLLFCIGFIISCFKTVNLTLGLSSVIIFASSIPNGGKYELNCLRNQKFKIAKNSLPLNNVVISTKTPIYKLNSLIVSNKYNRFMVIDENLKIVKTIYENEINELLLNYSATTEIGCV